MWRELISELTADDQPIGDLEPGPDFAPGATPAQLDAVEQVLGLRLPQVLRQLLGESNGVCVDFGQHLIWSTEELVHYNQPPWNLTELRHDHPESQRLFFFADAGVDGIRFGFVVTLDEVISDQIYAWYPIGDEYVYKASSLRGYIEGWLGGGMSV